MRHYLSLGGLETTQTALLAEGHKAVNVAVKEEAIVLWPLWAVSGVYGAVYGDRTCVETRKPEGGVAKPSRSVSAAVTHLTAH